MVYEQTAVLSWLVYTFTGLVGNLTVPVQVLPGFLQTVSLLTPEYYYFTGIRVCLGSNVAPAPEIVGVFALYTLILLGAGVMALDRSLKVVRKNGTIRWT